MCDFGRLPAFDWLSELILRTSHREPWTVHDGLGKKYGTGPEPTEFMIAFPFYFHSESRQILGLIICPVCYLDYYNLG